MRRLSRRVDALEPASYVTSTRSMTRADAMPVDTQPGRPSLRTLPATIVSKSSVHHHSLNREMRMTEPTMGVALLMLLA